MRTFILVAWALVAILLAACGSGPERAAVGTSSSDRVYKRSPARWSPGRRGDYANYPAAARLIERLVRKKGFRRAYLERIFARVERQQRVLDLVNRPRGKRSMQSSGSWTRYRAKFLTPDNISNGIGFGRRYGSTLRRAQARYGVLPEYVLAIISVETRYGAYLGKYRVIDALATLAFDYPRRSRFFTGELESFLIMVRNEGTDPFRPRGSYAGAMGLG